MGVAVVILVCAVGTTAFGGDEGKVSLGEVADRERITIRLVRY